MSQKVTTTRGGFTVEDITFKQARRQNEIDKELGVEEETLQEIEEVPVSLTPEQVIDYYEQLISITEETSKKVVFARTIRWIKELQRVKAELTLYKLKEQREEDARDTTPNDIE